MAERYQPNERQTSPAPGSPKSISWILLATGPAAALTPPPSTNKGATQGGDQGLGASVGSSPSSAHGPPSDPGLGVSLSAPASADADNQRQSGTSAEQESPSEFKQTQPTPPTTHTPVAASPAAAAAAAAAAAPLSESAAVLGVFSEVMLHPLTNDELTSNLTLFTDVLVNHRTSARASVATILAQQAEVLERIQSNTINAVQLGAFLDIINAAARSAQNVSHHANALLFHVSQPPSLGHNDDSASVIASLREIQNEVARAAEEAQVHASRFPRSLHDIIAPMDELGESFSQWLEPDLASGAVVTQYTHAVSASNIEFDDNEEEETEEL